MNKIKNKRFRKGYVKIVFLRKKILKKGDFSVSIGVYLIEKVCIGGLNGNERSLSWKRSLNTL
jgi:hypothetical protein